MYWTNLLDFFQVVIVPPVIIHLKLRKCTSHTTKKRLQYLTSDCASTHVIYVISCPSHLQYDSKTTRQLQLCINERA